MNPASLYLSKEKREEGIFQEKIFFMIKAIIFDLSDVCFNAEEPPFIKAFAKAHKLAFPEFETRYNELLVRAENHEISGKELWRRLLNHYGIAENPDKIIHDMIAGKKPRLATLAVVKNLHLKYKTAFFTNYNEDYWRLIAKRFDLTEYFHVGLVSYQIRARKPAVEGFKCLLGKLGVRAEETVFTDDTPKNLENAKGMGIHVIQFKNPSELVRDLRKLGVSIQLGS